MDIDELSRCAYQGTKPSDGLSDQDELLYWRLYEIYMKVKLGTVTVDEGKRLKLLEVAKYQAKQLRAKRINQILAKYAGAEESKTDGHLSE